MPASKMGRTAIAAAAGRIERRRSQMNDKRRREWAGRRSGGGGAVYGLGLIGALVYYIGAADGFWSVILGILKALVWPAFLVYQLFKFLAT
jgi:hypothetical protein